MGDLECYLTDDEIDEYGDYYIPHISIPMVVLSCVSS